MAFLRTVTALCLMSSALGKLMEMSWPMDATPGKFSFPPNGITYEYEYLNYGFNPQNGIDFEAFGKWKTYEHRGTHVDAPYHFHKTGRRLHDLSIEDLNGPLVKIDISAKSAQPGDIATVTISDLEAWEEKNGRIPNHSFVLMSSGWENFWGDNDKYFGTLPDNIRFPGWSKDAVDWLLANRQIYGIGTDTLSCDSSLTAGANVIHTTILPAGKVCIENIRNLDKVPSCGARFMALPIKLKDGTGGQTRAYAEWEEGFGFQTSCKIDLPHFHDY